MQLRSLSQSTAEATGSLSRRAGGWPMCCARICSFLAAKCLVRCWEGGESSDIRLGRWDLAALPPFLNHEIFNNGPGDCHVQTLLAKSQPLRPQYAAPELLELQAAQGEARRRLPLIASDGGRALRG